MPAFLSASADGTLRLQCEWQVAIKRPASDRWELYRVDAEGLEQFDRFAEAHYSVMLDRIVKFGWFEPVGPRAAELYAARRKLGGAT